MQHGRDPFGHLRLCTDLESTPLLPAHAFRSLGSGMAAHAADCVRQRLVASVMYTKLLPALMSHIARPADPVRVPAPRAWRGRLREQGVNVSRLSATAWGVRLVLFFGLGVRAAARVMADRVRGRQSAAPAAPYAVLMNIGTSNAPRRSGQSFDFASWYLQSALNSARVATVWAHVTGQRATSAKPNVARESFYLPVLDAGRFTAWVMSAIWLIVRAAALGLLGRWWEVVLLEQRLYLSYAERLRPSEFARAYVFNNAFFVLRPLWTHAAERAGATIDLAFYATNIETFGLSPAHPRPYWPGYQGMTWQRYAVWDDNQAQLIRDFGHRDASIVVAGPVDFSDGAGPLPAIPPGAVVIFDVTPQRAVSLARRGIPQPYYTSPIWRQFFDDAIEAVSAAGRVAIYKKKREIGRVSTGTFRTVTERRAAEGAIAAVDPDEAARRLIDSAAAVISMPFTSPAIIAGTMGKPSVYYDPLGVLTAEHRLAHGIPVVGSASELRAWLAANAGTPSVPTRAAAC